MIIMKYDMKKNTRNVTGLRSTKKAGRFFTNYTHKLRRTGVLQSRSRAQGHSPLLFELSIVTAKKINKRRCCCRQQQTPF